MLIITLSSILGLMLIGGAFWWGVKTGIKVLLVKLTYDQTVQLDVLSLISANNKNIEITYDYE